MLKYPDWTRLWIALAAICLGLLFLWGQVYSPHNKAASLDATNWWVRWAVVAFLLVGGATWAVSCIRYFRDLSWLWWFQQVGSLLSSLGFLGYTLALIITKPGVAITWILTLSFSLAALGSIFDSRRSEQRQRGQLDVLD